ncbi:hypothetical protein BCV72DRAFT_233499 [Rhizopus microsporus var. microsporus]|uniref:Uncharacterized protein n=1 Tax=Rhizopus microsporus var. microsporus TaxID=86635 RepID=A0A1X0QTS8_RHIZD|nr:hypothetical protein BCV72DRAFT_233499 [Rhizopus microsporus var. microsporus]
MDFLRTLCRVLIYSNEKLNNDDDSSLIRNQFVYDAAVRARYQCLIYFPPDQANRVYDEEVYLREAELRCRKMKRRRDHKEDLDGTYLSRSMLRPIKKFKLEDGSLDISIKYFIFPIS